MLRVPREGFAVSREALSELDAAGDDMEQSFEKDEFEEDDDDRCVPRMVI